MRTRNYFFIVLLAIAAASAGGCGSAYWGGEATIHGSAGPGEYADTGAGVDYFYDALAPYGTWEEIEPYGWVWCPLDVDADWRPYTVGYWSYTDAGWLWMAQDPWGSIPYHYGRWAFDSSVGWLWVPGDVWAPAWVAWRYGDGWVGWAPLPPEASWRVGAGFEYGGAGFDDRIDQDDWCFVRTGDFVAGHVDENVVPPSRNVTLLSITRNVTNYAISNGHPVERGLRPDLIAGDVDRQIPRYRIVDSRTPPRDANDRRSGQTIQVFRPGVRPGPGSDDRLRVAPPERVRTGPSQEMVSRQEQERSRLENRFRDERQRLDREHQRELQNPPDGVSRDELLRRQEAEMRAQDQHEQREREAVQSRSERVRGWMEERRAHGRGQDQGQDQQGGGRDRGQGRDRGPENN